MRHRLNFLLASEKASLFRSSHLALSLLALLSLAGVQFARADSQVRAVRLSNVSGSVQVATGGQSALQQAYANMPLTEGSHLQTGDDGRAEIQFEDGSVARLTPNTSLTMTQLRRDASGAPANGMQVLAGLAYFETAKQNQQPYVIQFADAQVTPAKGSIFRVNLDAKPAEVAVLHGSVHLASGSSYDVSVHENESVHLDAADPTRYQLSQGVNGDSWDEWNSDRDVALAAMASRETREAMLNGGGAGWSDLDYYGNWYNVPGYGNVWSPSGMTASWDPYGSGYWGFYQGPGYVWVSGYPWGWTPYRCGNWNYFNSYGWGWSPGGCGGGGGWGFGGAGDYGSGGIFIGTPPRNYRVPQRPGRPHPVAPGSNRAAASMIAVNRGPEATRLQPRPITGTAQQAIQVGNQKITPIQKTFNANAGAPAGVVRPGLSTSLQGVSPSAAHPTYVPVMRPATSPVAGTGPVYSQRSAPASSSSGQYRPSAPSGSSGGSYHSSAPAPMSSPSSAGAGSRGSAPSAGPSSAGRPR